MFKLRVRGDEAFEHRLSSFDSKVRTKIIKKVLRSFTKPSLNKARAATPITKGLVAAKVRRMKEKRKSYVKPYHAKPSLRASTARRIKGRDVLVARIDFGPHFFWYIHALGNRTKRPTKKLDGLNRVINEAYSKAKAHLPAALADECERQF